MNTFRIAFLFLIFIISKILLAQSHTEQQNLSFGKGRIKTIEGNKIYFSSIILGKGVHTYKAKDSNTSQTVDIAKVLKVEVQKGSYVLEVGAGSAIFGLVGSILFIKLFGPIGSDEWNSGEKTKIIAYSTAGSTIVGILIGSLIKKYKTIYSNPRYSVDMGIIEVPFNIARGGAKVCLQTNYHFLISYKF